MQISNTADNWYDPKDVILLLGGVEPVEYAEDTAIVLSKDQDVWLKKTGVDGSVALARNRDETGTITISLKNTSITNQTLFNYYTAAESGGTPWFPVLFRDPSSGIQIETQGWIQTQPDFTAAQEIMQLDWVIGVASVLYQRDNSATRDRGVQLQAIARGQLGDIDLAAVLNI